MDPSIEREPASDEALLRRFADEDDREAGAELARRHASAAYDLAFRVLRSESDAADATQSAFLKLFASARRFRGESSFRTWMFRVALHEALKAQSRIRRRNAVERSIDDERVAASVAARAADAGRDAWRAALEREVGALPDLYRLPIVLHYHRGLAYDEVAAVLGCAAGTVGSRLAAARDRLRARLASLGLMAAAIPDLESALRASPASAPPASLPASLEMLARRAPIFPAASASAWALTAAGAGATAVLVWVASRATTGAPQERASVAPPIVVASVATPVAPAPPAATDASSAGPRERVAAPPPALDATTQEFRFRVSGVVRRSDSGDPVSRARVVLLPVWPPAPFAQQKVSARGSRNAAETANDGAYAVEWLGIRPTLFKLSVLPGLDRATCAPARVFEVDAARDEHADFEVTRATPDELHAMQDVAQHEIVPRLKAAFERERRPFVAGIVQREDGAALQDVFVRAVDLSRDAVVPIVDPPAELDRKSGAFVVGPLPVGAVRLEAVGGREGFAVERIDVPSDGPRGGVVLTLRSGTARLAGVVVDDAGRPIEGARVSAFPAALVEGDGLPESSTSTTRADGRFELERAGAPGALLRVEVWAQGYRNMTFRGLAAGGDDARLVLRKPPKLEGRVVMKSTGAPPASFTVWIKPAEMSAGLQPKGQTMGPGVTIESATGRFSSVLNEPGRFSVVIEIDGRKPVARESVTVGEGGLDLGVIEIE